MNKELLERFLEVRNQSLKLTEPLEIEDFVVQPIIDVSPPKWHLAHTTWFFEKFVLEAHFDGYQLFNEHFPLLFNSYYVSAGDRWSRADRGSLTRPTVSEVIAYRKYVEAAMTDFLKKQELPKELVYVMEVGFNHEQQHQELLLYDIKYILGHNPLFPMYSSPKDIDAPAAHDINWLPVGKGNYHIGSSGDGFCFDNELGRHEVHLEAFEIADRLITNGEYLEFMKDGGYANHQYWLSDGWDWINSEKKTAPMYWFKEEGKWLLYSLTGLKEISLNEPVSHVSYYEADAFAKWKGARLPTEFEWEVASTKYCSNNLDEGNFVEDKKYEPQESKNFGFLGNLWEWTSSAYLPYPFYCVPKGALGEYNGKFMVNQHVLRGGSFATPRSHIRTTYRNFFPPQMQWLFSGIRIARHTKNSV